MFDFDASKFILIGIVALIFIGPKELPRVLRQVGQAVGKMRRMAAEFQGQFMEAMKEADMESVRQDLAKVADAGRFPLNFNPVRDIKNEIAEAVKWPQSSPTQPEAEIVLPPPAPLPEVALPSAAKVPAKSKAEQLAAVKARRFKRKPGADEMQRS